MHSFTRTHLAGRVAVITIDNPPVNALGPGVLEAIGESVSAAATSSAVDAIVLVGAGTTFVAGADINVFRAFTTREQALANITAYHAWLEALEDSPKPVVAAIHGHALGGGLELALACHYRVAARGAMLGLPEVTLGLIPGAGGTQRLPRLCGAVFALDLCTTGNRVTADVARGAGLVDEVCEGEVEAAAVAFAAARAAAGERRKAREMPRAGNRDEALLACASARTRLQKTARGLRAPLAAVEAIEAAESLDFASGSARERELFVECVLSTESKALRHMFFAERESGKVPDVGPDTPTRPIARAAVLGAGTMGAGIAMAYMTAGIPVILKDVDEAAVQRGMATIRKNFEAAVAKGRMTPEALDRTLALVTPQTSWDGFDAVDVVVEAVFEDLEIKRQTFAELGRVTPAGCVLASNTSTLDIDAFAEASGRPDAVIGHHFFSPANIMKLLEVVRGNATSASTIATTLKLARRLGKVPVVVGNCFGFVGNRLLAYYRREALLLLEEGASVAQIDGAMVEFGMPMGPFAMQDLAGLDVSFRIKQYLKTLGKTRADGPDSDVPDQLFEMGRYGQKTGAGWYRYDAGSRAGAPDPLIDQLAAEAAARRGTTRRTITTGEIVDRIMAAIVNEGARVLEEGHATRAGDIDVVYCYGYGFPRHRGGPMFYGHTIGVETLLDRLQGYQAQFGDYWKPSTLVERLAAEGKSFY